LVYQKIGRFWQGKSSTPIWVVPIILEEEMGLVKGLLLGTGAAVAMTAGTALAADLPMRKAEPVAYVKICDVYGRGFYYIPGTNTCLRVGGRVRFEMRFHRAQNAWVQAAQASAGLLGPGIVATPGVGVGQPLFGTAFNAASGTFNAGARQDTLGWRARAIINMDARTQTAWGTVQTVISMRLDNRSGIHNAGGGFAPGGAAVAPTIDAAYIRFAGFTFGRAPWIFASGTGALFYATNHAGSSPIGQLQLSYTAVFGGGFSATIGLVDKDNDGRMRAQSSFTNVFFDSFAGVPGMFNITQAPVHPNRLPMAVLSLRLDQGWGFVQVSGAVGQNKAVFNNGNGFVGNPVRTHNSTGWAVGASARINLPQLARGNFVQFYVAYANGLLDMINSNTANGSIAKDGRRAGGYVPTHNNWNIFACGSNLGVITAVCTQNTTALTAMASFTHYWTPTLRSNFGISYAQFKPGSAARNVDWFLFGGQPTSTVWQGSANLIWSPTAGFDLGLEFYYARTNNKLACGTGSVPVVGYVCTPFGSPIFSPTTVGVTQNPHDYQIIFRAQRTF